MEEQEPNYSSVSKAWYKLMALAFSASASLVFRSSVMLLMLISPGLSCTRMVNCIQSDMSLFPGNSLKAGKHKLKLEGDCTLVVSGSERPWTWNPVKAKNCYLILLSNGKLQMVSDADNREWKIGKAGKPDIYILKLLNEGKVVIVGSDQKELWSFNGSGPNRKLL